MDSITKLRQQGFSLIELMLTLALTLLIIGVIFTAVLADGATYEATHASNQLVNKSRMNLYTLRFYLQQAGIRNFDQIMSNEQPGPATETIGSVNWSWNEGQIINAMNDQTTFSGALAGSDVISIRYYGSDAIDGEVYQCDGSTLAAGTLNTLTFYVSNTNELTCLDASGTVTFDDDFDQLQVDFATNLAGDYEYVNANDVNDWADVGHLRIAVLVANQMERAQNATAQTYNLLGTNYTISGDSKVRQVVRDNINLPNNRG
ncbi:PilW family protein [Ferrimonas lipolytica]|uniref:Prepilin-type N-terminal cleavage/methylation domain-containing protein n=1 Tax=Ferrimonas lipolytica TaxID=2724191 RepID=A0A6H1UH52_9GAMM|nr:PilW family protein [Ferrimonas lipolytica]QIZ77122.1 hypothetical protein HER31_09690 [Ferrimonas lipolytica]